MLKRLGHRRTNCDLGLRKWDRCVVYYHSRAWPSPIQINDTENVVVMVVSPELQVPPSLPLSVSSSQTKMASSSSSPGFTEKRNTSSSLLRRSPNLSHPIWSLSLGLPFVSLLPLLRMTLVTRFD